MSLTCPCGRDLSRRSYFLPGTDRYETCETCQRQIKLVAGQVVIHPGRCNDGDPCDVCKAAIRAIPFTDVCNETAYGSTARLSFAVRVF